jgi:hypothetical protein
MSSQMIQKLLHFFFKHTSIQRALKNERKFHVMGHVLYGTESRQQCLIWWTRVGPNSVMQARTWSLDDGTRLDGGFGGSAYCKFGLDINI